jgi:hypothetical protein
MSMIPFSSFSASAFGRWKALRPMIEPLPPAAWIERTSARMSSIPLASPPEKTTRRRPPKQACTTWRKRATGSFTSTGYFW